MKLLYKISVVCCMAGTVFMVSSCSKQVPKLVARQQSDFSSSSLVQIYQATVNVSRNYIYVDGKAITGATMSSGSIFPPASASPGANLSSGNRAFLVRDTLGSSAQVPLSFFNNLAPGGNYTIFLYDTINSPKQKTVHTAIEVPADTTARIRFANFVYSATAVPGVDIFSKRRNVNLFTNINTTEVTNFIPVPSAFNDTFFVRETGTMNQLAVLNGLNPTQKRSYTLVFRGRYQSTTGTVARTLSSFVNY